MHSIKKILCDTYTQIELGGEKGKREEEIINLKNENMATFQFEKNFFLYYYPNIRKMCYDNNEITNNVTYA